VKIYLAGPWEFGPTLYKMRHLLEHDYPSIKITSSWLDIQTTYESQNSMEAANFALQDLADVDRADMLILFNPEGAAQSPGRNIEFGYALAKGKCVMVAGKRLGVFQHLPQVFHVPEPSDVHKWFDAYYSRPYKRK